MSWARREAPILGYSSGVKVVGRLLLLLAIARSASADPLPERAIVGVGVSAGIVALDLFYGAVSFQAGVRIPRMPLRVRAFAASGKVTSSDSDGDLYDVTAGVEWIFACTARVCGVAALDVGYRSSDRAARSENYNSSRQVRSSARALVPTS